MALIYDVTLRPSKLELLAAWLPLQPWAGGADGPLERVGSFRFDDPAGEVGVETLLVTTGGTLLQVPLTYRGAPLDDLGDHLVGTLDHPALGPRWVYDAVADPVYLTAITAAVLDGMPQAEQFQEIDGLLVALGSTATLEAVPGAGGHVLADAAAGIVDLVPAQGPLALFRRPTAAGPVLGRRALVATGDGLPGRVQLAAGG
jgi:hypothetical protein